MTIDKITKNIRFGSIPHDNVVVADNTLLFEIDTGSIYKYKNGSWSDFSGPQKQEILMNKTIDLANNTVTGLSYAIPYATTSSDGVVRLSTPSADTTPGYVVQANDTRLSNARTPTTHATTHKSGGTDIIRLDELALPTDTTTLDVSTSAHGLVPKLPNDSAKYLNGVGAWATISAGSWNPTGTETLGNKTIPVDTNIIKHSTTNAAGDLLKGDGTQFSRLARGTAYQVLAVNSGGTDIAWSSLNSENTGTTTASGNNSTTTFNVPHGLGGTPYSAFIQCSSHTIAFTFTYTSTNIVVVFASAPPSGTNNVIFQWRVIG